MFDIGWMELLLIGIVALIVVGPKDLPMLFRNVGRFMGKARGMAREFQRSMEQAADESGLREAARDLDAVNRFNVKSPTKSARKYAEGLVKDAAAGPAEGSDNPAGPPGSGTPARKKPVARTGTTKKAAETAAPPQEPVAAPDGDGR